MARVPMAPADTEELHKLYRTLMKRLHPDVHVGEDEKRAEYFALAQKAYQDGDIVVLRSLEAATRHFDPKDDLAEEEDTNALATELELQQVERSAMEKQLNELENCEDMQLGKLLQDPEWVSSRTAELREAIAAHLASFRGMTIDPDQVIIGAGTEYLYTMLIKLLGPDRIYAIENPGYKKLDSIYRSSGADCRYVEMDGKGLDPRRLAACGADIAHISPTHHFPTGITMPVSRRYELLAWAREKEGRYIIEDDYDSEFRLNGKPIPSLQSIDAGRKVIYMNTFSKSLTSTIRISYMVLPELLANRFFRELSFYSNTVSTFEQYTLAAFISRGYFEKHINRMRLHYGRKRQSVLSSIKGCFTEKECRVIENDSGLHFIIQFDTNLPDKTVEELLLKKGIKLQAITYFNLSKPKEDRHQFIINYSNIDADRIMEKLLIIKDTIL